jgi:hypothetical protein
MLDFQTISFYLGVFSVIFGVFTWYLQSRRSQKITQASLYMQLHSQWRDSRFIDIYYEMIQSQWKTLDEFAEKWYSDTEYTIGATKVIWYFESVGELLKQDLIDIDIVYNMLGDRFINWANKYGEVLIALRDSVDAPERYRNIEYLYEEMLKRQKIVKMKYKKKMDK